MHQRDTPARRVCIFGAGAIGLDLGVALLRGGPASLAFVARGPTLEALRRRGIEARSAGGVVELLGHDRYRVAEHPAELGEQDVVFLCVKSSAVWEAAAQLEPLLGPHTVIVTAMNGLPPWYPSGRPGIERHLTDAREREALFDLVARERILGAVINRNAACPAPGIVQRNAGTGLVVGELDGQPSDRLTALTQLLDTPDYTLSTSADIHRELWHKLRINASLNPISVVCERSPRFADAMVYSRARVRTLKNLALLALASHATH
jgi:2-dehydropantoate 2-reductase